jgi:hypothetical protein
MFRRPYDCVWALVCVVVAVPAFADNVRGQDARIPAEITGTACPTAEPGSPHAMAPIAADADCLAGFYPLGLPADGYSDAYSSRLPDRASEKGSLLLSMAGTLSLIVAGLGMLVLAGFNSRKRHRYLHSADLTGGYQHSQGNTYTHNDDTQWNEE